MQLSTSHIIAMSMEQIEWRWWLTCKFLLKCSVFTWCYSSGNKLEDAKTSLHIEHVKASLGCTHQLSVNQPDPRRGPLVLANIVSHSKRLIWHSSVSLYQNIRTLHRPFAYPYIKTLEMHLCCADGPITGAQYYRVSEKCSNDCSIHNQRSSKFRSL